MGSPAARDCDGLSNLVLLIVVNAPIVEALDRVCDLLLLLQ